MPSELSWTFRIAFAGDVNGDGCDDIVWGTDLKGMIAGITSGRDGSRLLMIPNGGNGRRQQPRVAAAGDVDQDGLSDIVIGLPYWGGDNGIVRVYSGRTAEILIETTPGMPGDLRGRSVDASDVNGDGVPDLLVGQVAGVLLFSGSDGAMLAEVQPEDVTHEFGLAARFVGDVDGDAIPDFLVGSERRADGLRRMRLYSGADFSCIGEAHENVREPLCLETVLEASCGVAAARLAEIPETKDMPDHLRGTLGISPWYEPLGDFDGDGVFDRVQRENVRDTDWFGEPIRARVVVTSGATGNVLLAKKFRFPLPHVVAGGDANGDGRDDVIIDNGLYVWRLK